MFIRSKIQFFESKSQPCFISPSGKGVVYQIKDTIFWKQITTCYYSIFQFLGCLSDQRYNFLKANHNQLVFVGSRFLVVYQIKDTIFWKQITTHCCVVSACAVLFIRSKIQFFESKSQPCFDIIFDFYVVYQIKDTIFWKQITTGFL